MMKRCPCHSGNPYAACCEPLHNGAPAPNAESLMRSRYSGYVLKDHHYLRNSWHTSTRPSDLTRESLNGTKWLGLTILEASKQNEIQATVTFEARYRIGKEKIQLLKETSNFVYENEHWFYIDGLIHS